MSIKTEQPPEKAADCSEDLCTQIAGFQQTILGWYRDNRRSFPWRETADPYRIIVSELMLQQTQTERVLPKYAEFLDAFPTAHDLAEAPLADVLEKWSGLGYNRRARFLQQACQKVDRELGGVFPHTPAELEKLSGVGPYTARAVACFAFGAEYPEAVEPFIETNIRSVYIFFFFKDDLDADGALKSVSDARIMPLVRDSIPSPDVCSAREWFYALMDYGAMLKKKTVNPNRRSSGYTKQSRFQGSVRQARGVILRQLVKNKEIGLTLSQIQKSEYIDIERLSEAAGLLCAENLIVRNGDIYRIV